jgi:hypothetical protein
VVELINEIMEFLSLETCLSGHSIVLHVLKERAVNFGWMVGLCRVTIALENGSVVYQQMKLMM